MDGGRYVTLVRQRAWKNPTELFPQRVAMDYIVLPGAQSEVCTVGHKLNIVS
jgi:hypothetical protein